MLKKGDTLGGKYLLISDFAVAGGRSRSAKATCMGKTYFVKEYLAPKWPKSGSGKEKRREACLQFEAHQRRIMDLVRSACTASSSLVCPTELIRVDSTYYKVSPWVESDAEKRIADYSREQVLSLMSGLCRAIEILHRNQIVHGDLKPDNVLVSRADYTLSARLIDFDDAYFSGQPTPEREALVGTPEYYAPEVYEYIADNSAPASALTCAADIYSLALVFIRFWTGCSPMMPDGLTYPYQAALAGKPLCHAASRHIGVQENALLGWMLHPDPQKRPTIRQVHDELKRFMKTDYAFRPLTTGSYLKHDAPAPEATRPRLRGTLVCH